MVFGQAFFKKACNPKYHPNLYQMKVSLQDNDTIFHLYPIIQAKDVPWYEYGKPYSLMMMNDERER